MRFWTAEIFLYYLLFRKAGMEDGPAYNAALVAAYGPEVASAIGSVVAGGGIFTIAGRAAIRAAVRRGSRFVVRRLFRQAAAVGIGALIGARLAREEALAASSAVNIVFRGIGQEAWSSAYGAPLWRIGGP